MEVEVVLSPAFYGGQFFKASVGVYRQAASRRIQLQYCQLELNKLNLLWGQKLIIADVSSEMLGNMRFWVQAEKPAHQHLLEVLGGLIVKL